MSLNCGNRRSSCREEIWRKWELTRGAQTLGHRVTRTTIFCKLEPNVWILRVEYRIAILAPRILRRLLDFRKICGHLKFKDECKTIMNTVVKLHLLTEDKMCFHRDSDWGPPPHKMADATPSADNLELLLKTKSSFWAPILKQYSWQDDVVL